jgi:hypothetical protein
VPQGSPGTLRGVGPHFSPELLAKRSRETRASCKACDPLTMLPSTLRRAQGTQAQDGQRKPRMCEDGSS